ncbi:MAG: pyruvate kinase [Microthrixaceae bacterium]
MPRRTKIIATLGPASDDEPVLRAMIEAGADVIRLNLAHGTLGQALERMRLVRRLAGEVGRPIGILADLPGPKVRLTELVEGGVVLRDGDTVKVAPGTDRSGPDGLWVDYPLLIDDVGLGDTLTIGDGGVSLRVSSNDGSVLKATVSGEGLLQGRPGLHVPSDRLTMSTPTAEDLYFLDALVEEGVDMIGVSFVRSAHDLRRLGVEPPPRGPLIVAKIETRSAVENLDGILEVAGAVMVARGDLGIECGIQELPHLQKQIIRSCIASGLPVITATQMLESMVHAASPTRAEITDVANAIFDGTSAVMLSAETAVGQDPVEVVATMGRIADRADAEFDYEQWPRGIRNLRRTTDISVANSITDAISGAAWRAATELDVAAIVCVSDTGFTVRSIARFRPSMGIIGLSPSPRTVNQLALSWGVSPMVTSHGDDEMAMVDDLTVRVRDAGHVRSGDLIAVVWGSGSEVRKTDTVRLLRVP